ncbi:endonuclease/exonuclease/phosphatase family protein [Paenibacillus sp. 1P07SE]|uniref:endonuclease/exonuclease/phosphatase family protein n=1 Tax=Paenibacillus sp. 1P07SE TaxID=3132209 RepID=UPI0039A634F7
MELKLMIYNIHHGRAMNGMINLDRIAALIQRHQPDIVGFNEVDRFFSRRSRFEDQFTWLSRTLGMEGAFGASIARRQRERIREYGNALLSRYPLTSYKNHGLKARSLTISEPRSVLEADIEVAPDRLIKVFVTHLSIIHLMQRVQVDLLARRIGESPGPTVLMGDMNMPSGGSSWRKLMAKASDVCIGQPKSTYPTFPSIRPVTQKDYIFVSPSIATLSVEAVSCDPSASDHLPLLATIRLP